MFALAAALLCSTAALGSTYAYADTAQDQAAQAAAQDQAFVPAVSGQITSCKITGDKQNIEIGFSSSGDAAGTDGKIYIFEMQPFEYEIGSRRDYAASAAALGSTSVTIPLNLGTPQDRLYSRFVLAVYDGADFLSVSKPHYITNPEIVAKNQEAFKDPISSSGYCFRASSTWPASWQTVTPPGQ